MKLPHLPPVVTTCWLHKQLQHLADNLVILEASLLPNEAGQDLYTRSLTNPFSLVYQYVITIIMMSELLKQFTGRNIPSQYIFVGLTLIKIVLFFSSNAQSLKFYQHKIINISYILMYTVHMSI